MVMETTTEMALEAMMEMAMKGMTDDDRDGNRDIGKWRHWQCNRNDDCYKEKMVMTTVAMET